LMQKDDDKKQKRLYDSGCVTFMEILRIRR
jgi:hypothetical protein